MERLQTITGLVVIFAGSAIAGSLWIADWLRIRRENERERRRKWVERIESVITGKEVL